MKPIQLWLPAFCSSPFVPEVQRIRQRAYAAWRGDDIVWIVPATGTERTGRDGPALVRMIDGEHLERLDVFHIGEQGYVWGPGMANRFPDRSVTRLLGKWLNVQGGSIYPLLSKIDVDAPDPTLPGIQLKRQEIRLGGIGQLPYQVTDREKGRVEARWPPRGMPLPIISVDQESREFAGGGVVPLVPLSEVKDIIESGRSVSLAVASAWPFPLDRIIPTGSGIDARHQQVLMRNIAGLSLTDAEQALQQARTHAAAYVDEGTSNWERAWFLPMLGRIGEEGALCNVEGRFSIPAASVGELLKSAEWSARAHTPIPIVRAWSGIGLMWALLLQELQANRKLGPCENCGRIISRCRGRRFCKRDENRGCVNERARARQGKSRSRRGS